MAGGGGGCKGWGITRAIKQRIQSSRIRPCPRHMVIATNLSSLFDLLHCSIPQTRTECCLDFAVVGGLQGVGDYKGGRGYEHSYSLHNLLPSTSQITLPE